MIDAFNVNPEADSINLSGVVDKKLSQIHAIGEALGWKDEDHSEVALGN